ncbi:FtsW/RodA/SpoVE family cell cycle protein [Bacillus sp. FJAT-26390]|uniref:FtsW/RodA/SpoVE family cell cycle protein n=1 Tax=Bacillus sp. FJAT-26390 TaxID=1743142 RepID=UPI000807BD1B|nr:FtsW/RodA/SpoVE family cell cycle protein [Bacillus sp. FJAT-26390]OBZ15625.1 hypothetical protein A7975_30835 [Bacillus sp. FJAT-26390]
MSKDGIRHESLKQYVKRVCGHVKAKDVHPDIELEITSHLDELVEDKLSEGLPVEEAARQALEQMGDPDQIGKQLHAAHKPAAEWGLAALVAIMVGIGLLAMYAVQIAFSEHSSYRDVHFFFNKSFYTAIGVILVIVIWFLDYRKLRKYSWHIYSGTVLLMAACLEIGSMVNGARSWIVVGGFTFDIFGISPYLFMIALAGTLMNRQAEKGTQGRYFKALQLGKMVLFYILVPMYLYIKANSLHDFFLYGIGLMIMLLFVAKAYKFVMASLASFIAVGAVLITLNPYRYKNAWERYTTFLNPANADIGYAAKRSMEAIRSGGMWGQGFGAQINTLPYIQSEMLFTYLIYSLGWVFGGAIILVTLLFIVRTIRLIRELKDSYARGMVTGIFSIIGFNLIWSILMSFGLLPINATNMPFVSYGGTNGIIELMAMGLILSVHRRRHMISQIDSKVHA